MTNENQNPEPSPNDLANRIAEAGDCDILLFNGEIERPRDFAFITLVKERRRRPNVILILVTPGGDADAAYKIARCLQKCYQKFTVFVPGWCKSAGTLITLGAHELIISDQGELGPLDVQFTKKDELWQANSALTVLDALDTLLNQSFETFQSYFLEIKQRSDDAITFRTATDIAAKVTVGLFTPIYQQVDPMHVGEAGRSLSIAQHYGERLLDHCDNFSSDILARLISHYPSHSFVIEREEAENLFNSVRPPTEDEEALADLLGPLARLPVRGSSDVPIMRYLNSVRANTSMEATTGGEATDGEHHASDSLAGSQSEARPEASRPLGSPEEGNQHGGGERSADAPP